MPAIRIFVRCPDHDEPSGGIRRLYRHVDVLRRHGYDAWLLHQKPGFRCSWFSNKTPIVAQGQIILTPADYLVVPEIDGPLIPTLARGVPKVIFNQNAYLTFPGFELTENKVDPRSVYLGPEIVGVIAVSEGNADFLRYAFPGLHVQRVHYGIDPIFAPKWPKKKTLAFMPRKNASDAMQTLHVLKCRGVLEGWEIAALSGMKEAEIAARLGEAMIFMCLGTAEGCPLPPLEAMASGCVVVGYHGQGGREYFDPSFSRPIEAGDILAMAKAIENLVIIETETPGTLEAIGRNAEAYVREHYSPEKEEEDIVVLWRTIISGQRERAAG